MGEYNHAIMIQRTHTSESFNKDIVEQHDQNPETSEKSEKDKGFLESITSMSRAALDKVKERVGITDATSHELEAHEESIKHQQLKENLESIDPTQRLAAYLPDTLAGHRLVPQWEKVRLSYTENLFPDLDFVQRYHLSTALTITLLKRSATNKETSWSLLEGLWSILSGDKTPSIFSFVPSLVSLVPHYGIVQELLSKAWELAWDKKAIEGLDLSDPLWAVKYFSDTDKKQDTKTTQEKLTQEKLKKELEKLKVDDIDTETLQWLMDASDNLITGAEIIQPTTTFLWRIMKWLFGGMAGKALSLISPDSKHPLKALATWAWVDTWLDPLMKVCGVPKGLSSIGFIDDIKDFLSSDDTESKEHDIDTNIASSYEIIDIDKTCDYLDSLEYNRESYREGKDKEEKKAFLTRLGDIAAKHGMDANHLMGVLISESNLQPNADNNGVACGIFQLTAIWLDGLQGTWIDSHTEILDKTPLEQLEILDIFLTRIGTQGARYPSIEAVYTALFAPAFLTGGKEIVADTVLYTKDKNPLAYKQNNLDHNNDGKITAWETAHRLKTSIMPSGPWFCPKHDVSA